MHPLAPVVLLAMIFLPWPDALVISALTFALSGVTRVVRRKERTP